MAYVFVIHHNQDQLSNLEERRTKHSIMSTIQHQNPGGSLNHFRD